MVISVDMRPATSPPAWLDMVNGVAAVVLGPVLTAWFFHVMSTPDQRPYPEWDRLNGYAALLAAVVVVGLAVGNLLARAGGRISELVNSLSVAVWGLTAAYAGYLAYMFLDPGAPACQGGDACHYEVGAIAWMFLTAVHWVVFGVLGLIRVIRRM